MFQRCALSPIRGRRSGEVTAARSSPRVNHFWFPGLCGLILADQPRLGVGRGACCVRRLVVRTETS